jgi:endonuclease YncB( thermonuclease family)
MLIIKNKKIPVFINIFFILSFNCLNSVAFGKNVLFNFYSVELIDCYDGDTCTFILKDNDFPSYLNPMSIRIYGIDTPEIKTSKNGNNDKILAQKAKIRTNQLLKQAKKITLKDCKKEKYFRFVCEIYADNDKISLLLLKEKLATPYFGGTKSNKINN